MHPGISEFIKTSPKPGKFALIANAASVDENLEYSWILLAEAYPDDFVKIFDAFYKGEELIL